MSPHILDAGVDGLKIKIAIGRKIDNVLKASVKLII